MTSNPYAPEVIEACAIAEYGDPTGFLVFDYISAIAKNAYRAKAKEVIRAFLANWRPEVSGSSVLQAYDVFREERHAQRKSEQVALGRALERFIDTMLAEARGV